MRKFKKCEVLSAYRYIILLKNAIDVEYEVFVFLFCVLSLCKSIDSDFNLEESEMSLYLSVLIARLE
jgi:hypothetical protein